MKQSRLPDFLQHEAAGGIVLMVAAAVALLAANTPLAPYYDGLLETHFSIKLGALGLDKPLLLWINDGLMAVFFFLVGLEIKRELVVGELSSWKRASLPAIAALGGMVGPALVYYAINAQSPQYLQGWAIPTATDIAFAVGVLALAGSSVPSSLKLFLLALAIIDDLGAILIIATFYTTGLSVPALTLGLLGIVALAVLNRLHVTRVAAYALVGIFTWVCVLKSGVHATLAGVATALAVPLTGKDGEDGPAGELEHSLHPWVTFGVLPIFAFANAGVSLAGITFAKLAGPLPLGIAAGLVLGKSAGIFASSWAAIKAGIGEKPEGASWLQLFAVAVLGGIGFTMSLFIGTLAFPESDHAAEIRIGVLSGSIVSALIGYALLKWQASRGSG
jgi:NhaA family Na+:H+ antiporter